MKILIVAPPVFPVSSGTGGSVEICIYEIGRRLAKYHQVTIISRLAAGLPSRSQFNNFKIVRIPPLNYWKHVIRYAKKYAFDCIQIDNRPEVVPLIKSHFSAARIVLNLHSLAFMRALSIEQQQKVIHQVHAVLCNSDFLKNYYRQQFPSASKKIHAIHLGTDVSRFRRPTPTEKMKIRARYSIGKSFNLLYSGRIIPKKGVDLLIKAAALSRKKYPFLRVVLVGPSSPKYRDKLTTLARKLQLPLTFVGEMSPSSMHRAYWLGDCFVSPTQFNEAFGLVNVEAMASGLPVIASHRGGIPEIISKRNGITIRDYRNPKAFSQAINRLIASPAMRRKFIVAGFHTARQRFSWSLVAAEYHRFYSGR